MQPTALRSIEAMAGIESTSPNAKAMSPGTTPLDQRESSTLLSYEIPQLDKQYTDCRPNEHSDDWAPILNTNPNEAPSSVGELCKHNSQHVIHAYNQRYNR